jgi:hypothetical protein
MSQDPFISIQVTIECRLYNGRLQTPLILEDSFLLYIRDQFTTCWLDRNQLRPGEDIRVIDATIISE